MTLKKRYALTVAHKAWESKLPIIVAHIPWDQFEAAGGPAAYESLLERTGDVAVIVSKAPDGSWLSTTKAEEEWAVILEATPLDSFAWHTMPIEAEFYPWELFGRET